MPLGEFLFVGLVAGWVMGKVRHGKKGGYGLLKSLLIGLLGSIVGWFLMGFLNLDSSQLLIRIVMAITGAALFFFVMSLFSGKKKKPKEEDDE